ncbi:MAG: ornithine carbamoyltransferase [Idiomarina sp.]|nr:ornithine carbamoyltransferase [Idiomarina sp.]
MKATSTTQPVNTPNAAITQCVSLFDLSAAQIQQTLALAHEMKANPANYRQCLAGKSVALLFEKPSLRTRVSFDVGIQQLGGHAVYLDSKQVGPGSRETVTDIANNLACWTQAIVARVYQHTTLQQLAQGRVPVVNALCDEHHPCQTLADLMTLQELYGDDLSQVQLGYVGDGNNVCQSLMLGAAALGLKMRVVTPQGFAPTAEFVNQLAQHYPDHNVQVSHALADLHGCDVLYTDTWISMGQEGQGADEKKAQFQPYALTHTLMQQSGAEHVMHCLPAHRDEEIESSLLDNQLDVVLRQAENRMHAQKALLALILQGDMV